jgi:hypothetical protein
MLLLSVIYRIVELIVEINLGSIRGATFIQFNVGMYFCTNISYRGLRGHDQTVVGFTTIYAISAYHH